METWHADRTGLSMSHKMVAVNEHATSLLFAVLLVVVLPTIGHNRFPAPTSPGKCAEEQARLRPYVAQGYQDMELPLCDVDGWYLPRYYCMWTGVCFCVDRRGKHIVARGAPPSRQSLGQGNCNVERDRALKQISAGMLDVELPECDPHTGLYKAGYHCCKASCYCIDEYGKKTPMEIDIKEPQ